MVREPAASMQPAPQDNQLMSKHRVLSFKPQLRLEWRGQDGQSETEQPDHSVSLGDSTTSSTQIRFSVHTGVARSPFNQRLPDRGRRIPTRIGRRTRGPGNGGKELGNESYRDQSVRKPSADVRPGRRRGETRPPPDVLRMLAQRYGCPLRGGAAHR